MLKISQTEPVNHTVTLRLEGSIVGPWVAELRNSCEEALTEGRPLKLHLASVEFMDAEGVALLSCLWAQGVFLLECPPFAAEQLKAAGNCSGSLTVAVPAA